MRKFIAKLLVIAASVGVIGVAPITAAEAYKVHKHHHNHGKHKGQHKHHKKKHHKKHH